MNSWYTLYHTVLIQVRNLLMGEGDVTPQHISSVLIPFTKTSHMLDEYRGNIYLEGVDRTTV